MLPEGNRSDSHHENSRPLYGRGQGEGEKQAGSEWFLPENFQVAVLAWFDLHGRKDLPWQQPRTPYRVWVSEIMLQQTQVATVIPYFERFLARFPDLFQLAQADEAEVLAHWSGLGYYARARNLHKAARLVLSEYAGELPAELETLQRLPGIGRSTAGAIMALGYERRATILDGNVKRILSRCFAVEGWSGETQITKRLWALSERYTPEQRVADYTQAMMDIGATLCTRANPQCLACPLQISCIANDQGRVADFPAVKPSRPLPVRRCYFVALLDEGSGYYYLQRRPAPGIWGGLWCFPQYEDYAEVEWLLVSRQAQLLQRLPWQRHTFSHFHLDYQAVVACVPQFWQVGEASDTCWIEPASRKSYGLPRPIERLFQQLEQEFKS